MQAPKKGRKGTVLDASRRARPSEAAVTNQSHAGSRTAFKQWELQVEGHASGVGRRTEHVGAGVTQVPRELNQTQVDQAAFNVESGQHPRLPPSPPRDPSYASRDSGDSEEGRERRDLEEEGGGGRDLEEEDRGGRDLGEEFGRGGSALEEEGGGAETWKKRAEEGEIWRKKAEEAEIWGKNLTEEANIWRKNLAEEAETWKKRVAEAEGRAHSAEARLAEANGRLDAERATSNHQAQQATRQLSEAEDRTNRLQAALAESEQELRRTRNKLRETTALLDTRSGELRDAHAYLTGLDSVADTEVLHLVKGINSRILQTAASITDEFQPRCGEQKDIRVLQEAAARVRDLLGDDLLHELSSINDRSDDSLMQTLLQAVMVSFTRRLCATWDFRGSGPQQVLENLYSFIRQKERQSVAGRWRALSRTYARMSFNDGTDPEGGNSRALAGYITDILLICGITGEPQDLRMEVGSRYADALRGVVHVSFQFQRITGEDIVSRDLLIVYTEPGEPFDPSRMVEQWADPRETHPRADPHPVLCTTQLGLVREERKAAGGEEVITTVVLLKPKVALTSLLEELSNEQGRAAYKT
ncbi:hypothetical protein GSI_03390 [Ganoderma sinense ZZ0214-1]|uniref:Uncharacterized protein n=1 Tax=Ganoderma sinense ZZ0214-1 TaxID=1077348 RepID=A0A2G8SLH7_9APHY|nr:hypothetical protein GSI_03390 [Ganoderma sinense ZZ0214-1]